MLKDNNLDQFQLENIDVLQPREAFFGHSFSIFLIKKENDLNLALKQEVEQNQKSVMDLLNPEGLNIELSNCVIQDKVKPRKQGDFHVGIDN